ncbi:Alpha-ketoglutarate-dependent dioxygenase AlkB-like [Trinorchestia longiramus]|nr:Alpha-ketoglutarate-dependent dioxygenase AlkB-like [Trinorchestia longiramus]
MAQAKKKLKTTSAGFSFESSDHNNDSEGRQNISATILEELKTLPSLDWQRITAENLVLDYGILFHKTTSSKIFAALEQELEYFTGDLARVKVFGKWHNIPRRQATYGDTGLTYTYSGITTPARPWPPTLAAVRDAVQAATGYKYNFVLVNRYKDGKDKMGEHKDDEKELDAGVPIASVSLGQPRHFYFVHQDARSKKRGIPKVTLTLGDGSILLMRQPTNHYWYHSLPPRASATHARINLTFRAVKKL